MSLLNKEVVKVVGEAHGFPEVSDDAAAALASDVEYRLRTIVQEASKFARHAKRRRLNPDDVNHALKSRNLEPLYGFSTPSLAGVAGPGAGGAGGAGGLSLPAFRKVAGDIFYVPDTTVNLAQIIRAPLPRCPVDITYKAHWLAVEGVQPAIPENPPVALTTADPQPEPPVKDSGVVEPNAKDRSLPTKAAVKPLVKHVLSRELQVYFKKITDDALGEDPEGRQNALDSAAQDPGLHQLVPYFAQFIQEKVTTSLKNAAVLSNTMRLAAALIRNPHLFLEPYLHQMMPSVMSCLVGKRLGAKAGSEHWALRRLAADIIAQICRKYGDQFPDIQSRVTKTLVSAFLDRERSLNTHFGAIVCLEQLGPRVVDLLLVENAATYLELLAARDNDKEKEAEARVRAALTEAIGRFIQQQRSATVPGPLPPPDLARRVTQLQAVFGEALLPFLT